MSTFTVGHYFQGEWTIERVVRLSVRDLRGIVGYDTMEVLVFEKLF